MKAEEQRMRAPGAMLPGLAPAIPVPAYIERARPVPPSARTPWYANTFPTYFGIFLWVGFYLDLGGPTLSQASIGVCLAALALAGVLCFGLYFYVSGTLGMKTGHSLYVVGSSTFGGAGGFAVPGLLMGVLQVGWVGVISSVAVTFILRGLGDNSRLLFALFIIAWVYSLGWVAIKGIHYVGRVAKLLNWVPLLMMLMVVWVNRSGIPRYSPPQHHPMEGVWAVVTVVIGYFASAGAAGADFGMTNRNRRDIMLGGGLGIIGGTVVAGGLAILSVAGYAGRHAGPASLSYSAAIASVGTLAPIMFFLFAACSLVPTCFSSFIASNSFTTMLPRVPRAISTLAALTVSALLAITGVAGHLVAFFSVVGASFGPVCGAMLGDYLLSGWQWRGPRPGVNWVGYFAWAVGFVIGVPAMIPGMPRWFVRADNPSVLYALIGGLAVYVMVGKLSPSLLRPPVAVRIGNAL